MLTSDFRNRNKRILESNFANDQSLSLAVAACWFALLCCCHAAAQSAPRDCTYSYRQQAVDITEHRVIVESYLPDGRGPFPLILMLHGSAGAYSLRSATEPAADNFGEKALARSCFVVVLPHYFEALGFESITSKQQMENLFPQLLAVASTILTRAETMPPVKGQPVFLFGESLGGYLSVVLGLQRSEVKAISEISGGLPSQYTINDPHKVAVLISHGKDDLLVPVQIATDLRRYCLTHHLRVEINLYPGVGHYLPHSVENKCIAATTDFFIKSIAHR